jgi:hypothetical protein
MLWQISRKFRIADRLLHLGFSLERILDPDQQPHLLAA